MKAQCGTVWGVKEPAAGIPVPPPPRSGDTVAVVAPSGPPISRGWRAASVFWKGSV